jgi:hypothetical protein
MKRFAYLVPVTAVAIFAACQDMPVSPNPDEASPQAALPSYNLFSGVAKAAFTTTNPNWPNERPTTGSAANRRLCLHGPDGDNVINCNHYGAKKYVWLNGGPLAAQLLPGDYFFSVHGPGGQPNPNDAVPSNLIDRNLSDHTDPWQNRAFRINADRSITYPIPGLTIPTPTAPLHDFDTQVKKLRVGVAPGKITTGPGNQRSPDWYQDTPNPGGVYILAICRISAPSQYPVNARDCKYDAFKVRELSGPPEVIVEITPPRDVNEVGDEHTFGVYVKAAGGTLPYRFDINATVTPGNPPVTVTANNCTVTNAQANAEDGFAYECEVKINTPQVLTATLNVTATVRDNAGNSGSASTGANNLPSSDDGKKFYVDAKIEIAPSEVNGIGEQHVFTVTFTAYPDEATPTVFNSITPSVVPQPDEYSTTCGTPTEVSAFVRSCTITIRHNAPGVFTANATGVVTMGADQDVGAAGEVVTRSTDGQLTVAGGAHSNSGPAIKEYVAGNISWNKVDPEGNYLPGAVFRAERIALRPGAVVPGWITPDPVYTNITDCVAAPCNGLDKNPLPGQFQLVGLGLGTWKVTETAPPPGYTFGAITFQEITIDLTNPPGSLSGSAAVNFVNPLVRLHGCTPGFWKQPQHYGFWRGQVTYWPVDPQTRLDNPGAPGATPEVFREYRGQGGYPQNMTMRQALDLDNSAGIGQVLRHGVAALLNANNSTVIAGSRQQVMDVVNAALIAFDNGNQAAVNAAHATLAGWNENFPCNIGGQNPW